ncbi:MAG: DNA-processing protein DprA, partial [Oscillospiraceae bacterium]|nr:DNA-processing protein DprA [Oscillospiraceae bacterium]
MTALKYWLWLSLLQNVRNQMKLALLEHFGGPDAVFFAEEGEYALVEGMTRSVMQQLKNKSLTQADETLGRCERIGLRIITLHDAEYPYRLKNIYDPPLLLYVQGRMPCFDDEVAIAMVGSRDASAYAMQMAEKIAFQLTSHGALVVSGLAENGDASAHIGALRAGGVTVGVIAGGHDVVYPPKNRHLYEDLAVRGAILSEYPPGTKHMARHFPVRNRILSGLCLATVVIEAPERSGTLITANHALEQGRDVFAFPGQMEDWHCIGSNRLLRDGAGVVTDVWDILNHYAEQYPHRIHDRRRQEPKNFGGGREVSAEPEKPAAQEPQMPVLDLRGDHGLTDDQIKIVRSLQGRTLQVDDLIEETQIPTRRVLSALTVLEIEEIVTQE